MNHPCIVKQQQRPRFSQRKAHAVRAVCVEYARLTAFDTATVHQNDSDEIDAVPMRTFGRRAADALCRVNAKLVCFNEPLRLRRNCCADITHLRQQGLPRCAGTDLGSDRLKPAFDAAVQRVVIHRLPMGAVRYLHQ